MPNEYYWQDMLSKLVTKTQTSRRPSSLHKRITKSAYMQAAQHHVQATKARCICVDFINRNPDPVPNPDCPIHGAGFRA